MRIQLVQDIKRIGAFVYALTDRGVNAWWAQIQSVQRASEGEASASEMIEIAQLFQAAPDLLKALERLLACSCYDDNCTSHEPACQCVHCEARTAIDRAKGKR